MADHSLINRRHLLAGAAAFAPGAALAQTLYSAADYDRAVVIDALGSIGDPEGGPVEGEPSARLLADLKASGLTAISQTLSVGTSGDRMAKAVRKIASFNEKVAAAPHVLMRIRKAADLKTAKETGRVGLIFNVQDTSLLETDLSRVLELKRLGLRVMQLTYNQRNPAGDGCLEPANSGLSNFGRDLVAEIARQRLVLDLSHSGQRTIAEGIAAAEAPPVISHTGCRTLVDVPRNTYDAELKALADKGGVAGIYFMPFLSGGRAPTPDDLIRHIEHAVKVCGEDHVGLGTDGIVSTVKVDAGYREGMRREFEDRVRRGLAAPGETADGFQFVEAYNEPRKFLKLAQDLSRRGWPGRRIDKLLGGNFARVFGEVWG